MSAFEDALALDAEREIFDGEVSQEAVRIKRDGSRVDVLVAAEFIEERIEQREAEEGVASVVHIVAPIAQAPEMEEGWLLEGLRYAVKSIVERNAVWITFEAERWTPIRQHSRGTYVE